MDAMRHGFTACRYRAHSVLILALPWVCASQEAARSCCVTSLLAGPLVLLIIHWPTSKIQSMAGWQTFTSTTRP